MVWEAQALGSRIFDFLFSIAVLSLIVMGMGRVSGATIVALKKTKGKDKRQVVENEFEEFEQPTLKKFQKTRYKETNAKRGVM